MFISKDLEQSNLKTVELNQMESGNFSCNRQFHKSNWSPKLDFRRFKFQNSSSFHHFLGGHSSTHLNFSVGRLYLLNICLIKALWLFLSKTSATKVVFTTQENTNTPLQIFFDVAGLKLVDNAFVCRLGWHKSKNTE